MSGAFRPPALPVTIARPPRGRVLAIAPHPDDESVGIGGTLRHHVLKDDPVRVIFVCNGIQGDPDGRYDRAAYPALREAEARRAAGVLGVADLEFWGYTDNLSDGDYDIFQGLPPDPDDKRRVLVDGLGGLLERAISEYRPEIVYYPWSGEVHPDHWACGMAIDRLRLRSAAALSRVAFLGYETWSASVPDTLIDVSAVHDRKICAIRCYETQLAYTDLVTFASSLASYRALLFERRVAFAEAFTGRFLTPTEEAG